MEKRICLTCEEPLRGRSDKKFCDDGCRSLHHQQKSQEQLGSLRQINALLRKNRQILAALFSEFQFQNREAHVDRWALIQRGFVFDFHTHRSQNAEGKEICCVYDLGLMEDEKGGYRIAIF